MVKQHIGIIGQGFVGNAIRKGFENTFEIFAYDIKPELSNVKTVDDVLINADVIFVCLPTPMTKEGNCYIGILEEAIKNIDERVGKIEDCPQKTLIIKSTIPPGTTAMLNEKYKNVTIIFSPEFLTEANSIADFENQNRILIGVSKKEEAEDALYFFKKRFPNIAILVCPSNVAEMVKYTTNTFLSTKVAFANEIHALCEKLNIDYYDVINLATYDERLGMSHWRVPGPDGDFGFGGHCFPKDLNAILFMAKKLDIQIPTLTATWETNNIYRKNKDWEDMDGRAVIDK